jgi:hypothetical protein
MNEASLIEKLLRIQALHAGATTEGERIAAEHAYQRIHERIRSTERADPPIEYRFSMEDEWSRLLFLSLVRRHGLEPYRYRRQRRTTVMVRVSKGFVDRVLWPEFEALSAELRTYLHQVTERVIREGLHGECEEAQERDEPAALPGPT